MELTRPYLEITRTMAVIWSGDPTDLNTTSNPDARPGLGLWGLFQLDLDLDPHSHSQVAGRPFR